MPKQTTTWNARWEAKRDTACSTSPAGPCTRTSRCQAGMAGPTRCSSRASLCYPQTNRQRCTAGNFRTFIKRSWGCVLESRLLALLEPEYGRYLSDLAKPMVTTPMRRVAEMGRKMCMLQCVCNCTPAAASSPPLPAAPFCSPCCAVFERVTFSPGVWTWEKVKVPKSKNQFILRFSFILSNSHYALFGKNYFLTSQLSSSDLFQVFTEQRLILRHSFSILNIFYFQQTNKTK